eukprot:54151_1
MSFWFNLVLWLVACDGWLYEPSHPLKKVTRLFERLKYYEIIRIKHNQFHLIDTGDTPIYPMNGKVEFHAFGHYYKLLIRKNVELFADNFVIERRTYDPITNRTHKTQSFDVPQCHYTSEIVSDPSGTGNARFYVCRGHGLQGWIHAFGETIVIRPKRLLTDFYYKGNHSIYDHHIVYKYHDLDRSDYQTTCGHDHHQHRNDDTILNLFDHLHKNNTDRRGLQTSFTKKTRYVELAVVNDPARMEKYKYDEDILTQKSVQSIATIQSFYFHTDWGAIGTIVIVLSHVGFMTSFDEMSQPALSCEKGGTEPNLYVSGHTGAYCEVQYDNYLNLWNGFRSIEYSAYDNAHLLSYYDFESSVIGYASISGMCSASTSGAIDQVTYDDEYNGNIIAHEMGHNFGMQHDGLGNTCDPAQWIMASKGSTAARPNAFSSCSIVAMAKMFAGYKQQLQCLDNEPLATEYSRCRNGFVELGEVCDCGQEDCTLTGDTCCDGSTCGLYAFAQCSNQQACCSECSIVSGQEVCRVLNEDNPCDIEEELCDGDSPECPPDTFYVEGTTCGADSDGYCYQGTCRTMSDQCVLSGYTLADLDRCGYSPNWQVHGDECSDSLKCWGQIRKKGSKDQCEEIGFPVDGTPCNKGNGAAAQCKDGSCELSSSILSAKWIAYAWNECSISCKQEEEDASGNQTREVKCSYQDGTEIDDTECVLGDKPSDARICNDFVCHFCAYEGICGENGVCDAKRGVCDCNSGYDGELCDIPPSLNFTGIVSMVYKDSNAQKPVLAIANPCSNAIVSAYYEVESMDGLRSLDTLYIGSTIGIRWTSGGSIDSLAIGMIRVDVEEDGLWEQSLGDANYWPFYVGNALALNQDNKESCDELDNECYEDITCNDFTFTIPTELSVGAYRVLIRFNNVYNLQSDVVNIICSESNCNSTGHGRCDDELTELNCICDDGWSGNSCDYSVCDSWTFAMCSTGGCETQDDGVVLPKCFTSQCDYNLVCNTTDGCSDPHFEGAYCEIPNDYCSTLDGSKGSCNADAMCEYTTNGLCVYSDCYSYKTEVACTGSNSTIKYDDSWNIFCEWDNGYCNRITCGNDALPLCENGAVRKPLYDEYSVSPQSICNGWYCDCSRTSSEDTHWADTDLTDLFAGITSDYLYDEHYPLTADYIEEDALPLFTCSHCGLECAHGSDHQEECIDCSHLCPEEESPFRTGVECNQLFWILSFALKTEHSSVIGTRFDEFSSLLITDLAYFLGTDARHVSLWQVKPDESGHGSLIYFLYLFDTDDELLTQSMAGDIMILASAEFADATSTASRGFVMKYTNSNYKFNFCVPQKEECDPQKQFDFNQTFVICFFVSFAVEILAVIIYRILTRKRRQEAYEQKVREQKLAINQMMNEKRSVTRIGMRAVSKRRARKIANAKKSKRELDKLQKTAHLDAAESPKAGFTSQKWLIHDKDGDEDVTDKQTAIVSENKTFEMISLNDKDEEQVELENGEEDEALPPGWKQLQTENGEIYFYNMDTGATIWERPQLLV